MPNVFSSIGYASQGLDAARNVQQDYDLGQSRLAAEGQAAKLRNDAIETSSMGLEDLRRNRALEGSMRQAGATAIGTGKTISGSLLDMSDVAAKAGDVALAQQIREAYKQLEMSGAKDVIHAALTDPRPGDRPDIVQLMKQNERTKDAVSAQLDPKGNLTVTHAGKPPSTVNVGELAERMGLVKPFEKDLKAGDRYIRGNPLTGAITTDIRNDAKTTPENYQHGYITKKVKDADGNETDQIIDIRPGSPTYGKEVAPGAAPAAGGTNVRKDLPVLNDITKGIADLGAEYGKTDLDNMMNPRITLTKKGQDAAFVAEALRLANNKIGVRAAIDMATKGEAKWKIEDGKTTAVLIFNGEEHPMAITAGKPIAKPSAPAPAARAAAAKPAPAAARAPAVPAPPVAAPPVAAVAPEALPAPAKPAPGTMQEKMALRDAAIKQQRTEAAKKLDSEIGALKEQIKTGAGFGRGGVRQAEFRLSLLESERKAMAARGYAMGGKVSKVACHGLG